jgi:hypothetical protein
MGDIIGIGAAWFGNLELGEVATVGAFLAALAGIGLTLVQLHFFRRQLQLEALIQIMDSNREIVSLGFEHPHVWRALSAEDGVVLAEEALARRRYLQLWTNHMQVIWAAWRLGLVSGSEWQAYRLDLAEFLRSPVLQAHWANVARYYPREFQRLVNRLRRSGSGDA